LKHAGDNGIRGDRFTWAVFMTPHLTDLQQRLIDTDYVLIVGKNSEEIPAAERHSVRRGFAGSFGNTGLACTLLRDDGRVLIITDGKLSQATLRHEFIHAAQCFAGEETMSASIEAAIEVGRSLTTAIRAAVFRNPAAKNDHRDLETTTAVWGNHAAGKGTSPDIIDFQFFQDLYPTKETAALAAEVLGFDYPKGAYAALTAYVCHECGYQIDVFSDFARELVGYTFEMSGSAAVDDLMVEAAENIEKKSASRSHFLVGAPAR
jgi:hypothetical protein